MKPKKGATKCHYCSNDWSFYHSCPLFPNFFSDKDNGPYADKRNHILLIPLVIMAAMLSTILLVFHL